MFNQLSASINYYYFKAEVTESKKILNQYLLSEKELNFFNPINLNPIS